MNELIASIILVTSYVILIFGVVVLMAKRIP